MDNLKGAVSTTALVVIAIIAIAGIAIYMNPSWLAGFGTKQVTGPPGGGGGGGGGGTQNFATNIRAGAIDAITGALANTNAELYTSGDSQYSAVVNTNGVTSVTSTGPSSFHGYLMIGNDDYASVSNAGWTDRGTEYYVKRVPIDFDNKAGDVTFSNIPVYAESSPGWDGFDAGTLENATNITVGSGATVDTTELRIYTVASQSAIGNPDFNAETPLGICFNTTLTGLSIWNDVRPLTFSGILPVPKFLSNVSVINGNCYGLNTPAIVDSPSGGTQSYRFFIRMQAKSGQDPIPTSNVAAFAINKCWVKADNGVWIKSYGYDSVSRTSQQCGFDTVGDAKLVASN